MVGAGQRSLLCPGRLPVNRLVKQKLRDDLASQALVANFIDNLSLIIPWNGV